MADSVSKWHQMKWKNMRYDPQSENLKNLLDMVKKTYYHIALMEFVLNIQLFHLIWKQTNYPLEGNKQTNKTNPQKNPDKSKPQKIPPQPNNTTSLLL